MTATESRRPGLPAGRAGHLVGKGLFVRQAWSLAASAPDSVARWARALALDFVVVKVLHGAQAAGCGPDDPATGGVIDALRTARITVWGWADACGLDDAPEAAAEALEASASELGLSRWVWTPAAGCQPETLESWVAHLETLRRAAVVDQLGMLFDACSATGSYDAGDLGFRRSLVDCAKVLMPVVSSAGSVGLIAPALAGTRGQQDVVPVLIPAIATGRDAAAHTLGGDTLEAHSLDSHMLDAPTASGPGEVGSFMVSAFVAGAAGVALLAWDDLIHTRAGRTVLEDFGRAVWPPPDAVAVGETTTDI